MAMMARISGLIPTDHWEFFVQTDQSANWDIDVSTFENRRAAACPAGLAVATARMWGATRVEVELHDRAPEIPSAGWDDIEHQVIEVKDSELLVFAAESTGTDRVLRMPIDPGTYLAAVLIGGLETVTDDVGAVGDDHYRIVLWPRTLRSAPT